MQKLTLAVGWNEDDDAEFWPEDYEAFAGRLRDAAGDVNRELGREVVVVNAS